MRNKILKKTAGALLALSLLASGELIPPDRVIDWQLGSNVGVTGGIDRYYTGGANQRTNLIDVTGAPYNAVPNDGVDDSAAIQAAVDAVGSTDGVYVPAGTYRLNTAINLGTGFSNKTFRGAGMDVTIFDVRTNSGIGLNGVTSTTASGLTVTGGLTKGSTAITIPSWPGYTSGYMYLQIENDDTIPVVSVNNYDVWTHQAPQKQLVRITGASGTTVNIDPPLHADYSGEVRPVYLNTVVTNAGIEDLTVDLANFPSVDGVTEVAVGINSGYNCWLRNVKGVNVKNYGITVGEALLCTVRHCYGGELKGVSTNNAAFLFTGWNCLVEDNIFVNAFPNIEVNNGSQGNVFAYNFGNGAANTNHAPHNRFNLHEGNAWYYQISDGYFGGESDHTAFRNYYWSTEAYGTISIRRFGRDFSVIGNLHGASEIGDHGYPNIGNTDSFGTAQLSLGDPWRDYQMTGTLTTRTDDINGQVTVNAPGIVWYASGGDPQHVVYLHWGTNPTNQARAIVGGWSNPVATLYLTNGTLPDNGTAVTIGPGAFYDNPGGSGSYQELDLDVAATTLDKGNYYIGSSTYTSLGGDALPDSLIYDSQPSWWPTSLAWPPYVATNPSTADINRIPAGYRYTNGVDPDTEAPSTGKRARIGGKTIRIGGKVLNIGDN